MNIKLKLKLIKSLIDKFESKDNIRVVKTVTRGSYNSVFKIKTLEKNHVFKSLKDLRATLLLENIHLKQLPEKEYYFLDKFADSIVSRKINFYSRKTQNFIIGAQTLLGNMQLIVNHDHENSLRELSQFSQYYEEFINAFNTLSEKFNNKLELKELCNKLKIAIDSALKDVGLTTTYNNNLIVNFHSCVSYDINNFYRKILNKSFFSLSKIKPYVQKLSNYCTLDEQYLSNASCFKLLQIQDHLQNYLEFSARDCSFFSKNHSSEKKNEILVQLDKIRNLDLAIISKKESQYKTDELVSLLFCYKKDLIGYIKKLEAKREDKIIDLLEDDHSPNKIKRQKKQNQLHYSKFALKIINELHNKITDDDNLIDKFASFNRYLDKYKTVLKKAYKGKSFLQRIKEFFFPPLHKRISTSKFLSEVNKIVGPVDDSNNVLIRGC